VARIFLNRPQKVNALDTALLEELAAARRTRPVDAQAIVG
jgi:enoyl-CoA hydratase/carnithine racemase